MIGNDIVAIDKLFQRTGKRKERYYEKTYTENEIRLIKTLNIKHVEGFLWAIKESAYKQFFRETEKRINSPRQFEVLSITGNYAEVRTPVAKYFCETEQTENYFHALSTSTKKNEAVSDVFLITKSFSEQVKELISNKLGEPVEIEKNNNNVPSLLISGKRYPLSLSHDGSWGAYAYVLNELS